MLAVRIQAPRLASEQTLTVPLGSTVDSCTVPCMSLRAPASLLTPDVCCAPQHPLSIWHVPLDLKTSTHSPLCLPKVPCQGT